MSGHRWTKFWWQDYENDPALRMCGAAAQGVWMRMLCRMHEGEPYGHFTVNGKSPTLRQISMIVGFSEKDVTKGIAELEDAGVFSRTEEGVMFCRRMVRDKVVSDRAKEDGRKGGNPGLKGNGDGGDKPRNNGGGNGGGLTPTLNLLEAEAEAEAEAEKKEPPSLRSCPHSPFDDFWEAYPRKKGKDDARKAWDLAVKRASPAEIADGLNRQRFSPDPKFIPYPGTWLRAGSWQDDPTAAAPDRAPPEPRRDLHAESVAKLFDDLGIFDDEPEVNPHRRISH